MLSIPYPSLRYDYGEGGYRQESEGSRYHA